MWFFGSMLIFQSVTWEEKIEKYNINEHVWGKFQRPKLTRSPEMVVKSRKSKGFSPQGELSGIICPYVVFIRLYNYIYLTYIYIYICFDQYIYILFIIIYIYIFNRKRFFNIKRTPVFPPILPPSQASQAGRSSPGKSPGKFIMERSHSEDGNLEYSHLGFCENPGRKEIFANAKKTHERR